MIICYRYGVNIASAFTDYTQRWFGRRVAHTVPLAFTSIGFIIHFIIICSGEFTLTFGIKFILSNFSEKIFKILLHFKK